MIHSYTTTELRKRLKVINKVKSKKKRKKLLQKLNGNSFNFWKTHTKKLTY